MLVTSAFVYIHQTSRAISAESCRSFGSVNNKDDGNYNEDNNNEKKKKKRFCRLKLSSDLILGAIQGHEVLRDQPAK